MANITIPAGVTSTGLIIEVGDVLNIESGGSATNTTENGGAVNITDGGYADFLANTVTGQTINNYTMTVHKNTVANENLFVGRGILQVYDGGIASENVLKGDYIGIEVNSGAKVTGTTAYVGSGYLTVNSGGSAENTVYSDSFYWGAHFNVMEGAAVTGTTITGGRLYVQAGAEANATLMAGGEINATGTLSVFTATGGTLNVLSGGVLTGEVNITGGNVAIAEGGTFLIDLTSRAPRSAAEVSGIGKVTGTKIITVKVADTQANGKYVLSANAAGFDGTISVTDSAGVELGTLTVNESVKIGETDYHLVISANSLKLFIGIDVIPTDVYVNDAWSEEIAGATVALKDGGIGTIGYDAFATADAANAAADPDDGTIHLEAGAISFSSDVHGVVVSGGVTLDLTGTNVASANIQSGGKLTGKMAFGSGAEVAASNGAIIDFDLTKTTAGAETALLNDQSLIAGAPLYTLTVSGSEAFGDYKLADGAAGFDKTVSVVNASGEALGVLTPGITETIGTVEYTLNLSEGGNLTVTLVEGVDPTIYTGDLTDATKDILTGSSAVDVNVYSGGALNISGGGAAIRTNIYSSGGMFVYEGAAADSTTVHDGGSLLISGGTATGNTVNSGGVMYTFGTANDTTVNNGGFFGLSGGTATGNTVNSGGFFWGEPGTTLNGVAVNFGGYVGISSGCTAGNVVENGGYVYIPEEWEGGQPNVSFTPNSFSGLALNGTWATVHSGTTATDTTVNASGIFHILSGGIANGATVNPGGEMAVNGGVADNIDVNASGFFRVYNSGIATGAAVNPGGQMEIFNNGSATGVTVNSGVLVVYTEAAANSAAIGTGAQMHILGTATDTTVSDGGYVGLSAGIMNHVIVDNASLWVAGGTAGDVAVNPGGYVGISSGGTAAEVVENGGFVMLREGGLASFKPNSFSGLTLNGTWASLHSGTTATDTTVNSDGILQILLGGVANNTTINAGGSFQLNTNGTAVNVAFNSGCLAELAPGGRLTGRITFESGAVISAMDEAILDFDLTRTSAGAAALVNDLSFIPNTALFALTIDGTETDGTYYLAGGAAGFEAGIYVLNSDWSMILGGLTVDSALVIGTSSYALTLTDDVLAVTVSFVTPEDVYVNTEWSELPAGTIVTVAEETEALIGYNAFADVDDAFAAVSEDGEVYVVGGSVSFGGAVDKPVTIGDGVTLTGKAVFERPVSLDGTVVFDTEIAGDGVQFAGFDKIELGEHAAFTLNASPKAVGTSVTLATGAAELFKREIASDDFDFVVGAPDFYLVGGIESYVLDLDKDQNLVLSYVACENKSDGDVKNGYLVKKKAVNPHIGELQRNIVDEFSRVLLDDKGTVLESGNYNFVGGDDKADYARITTTSAAKLRFSVKTKNLDDKVKLSLVSYDAATGKTKTLKSAAVSKGKEAFTAAVFVDPNDPKTAGLQYFVAVENKGKTNVFYNVALTSDSDFYVDADDGHNNSLVEKKVLNPYIDEFADTEITSGDKTFLQLENDDFVVTDHGDYANWVGFGDDADFARISPDAPAILNFTLNGKCDAGTTPASLKFTVYSLTLNGKGEWTQNEIKSKTLNLKNGNSVSTGILYLDRLDVPADDKKSRTGYYVSVQSTNAKKGGEAYYSVTTTGNLYEDADYSIVNVSGNGWLFNKNGNAVNGELEKSDVAASGQSVIALDTDVSSGDYANFVGFGDAYDYAELVVSANGLYNFKIDTTGKAKFTVYSMTRKNGKWTQKVLGSQTIKDLNGAAGATLKKDVQLTATSEDVRYFVSMQAADTKKSPEVYYNVTAVATVTSSNAAVLAMPESDKWSVSDALSFASSGSDLLADASSSSLADLDDKTGWLNIASLA